MAFAEDKPIGGFYEKECGKFFEFSANPELTLAPPAHGGKNMYYPHRVWVTNKHIANDSGWRYAKVMKTCVHIILDEDDSGWCRIEKWDIKSLRLYGI